MKKDETKALPRETGAEAETQKSVTEVTAETVQTSAEIANTAKAAPTSAGGFTQEDEEDPEAERYDEIERLAQAAAKAGNPALYIPPGHEGEEPLLKLRDIYKIYQMGTEEIRANDGISLNVYQGEFVAIVGKSGSGKSTLMNIIGALDVPTKGEYYISGEDVSHMSDDELAEIRNKKIGFIFQQYNLLPKDTLLDNVALPLLYAGYSKSERQERARKQLERVGLGDKALQHPMQLSGGQQQRVSIARALAGDPSLILADEPTGALDSRTSRQVLGFLKQINEEGNTVVMITHDNSIALEAKRIVRISDGKIVYDGSAEEYAKLI